MSNPPTNAPGVAERTPELSEQISFVESCIEAESAMSPAMRSPIRVWMTPHILRSVRELATLRARVETLEKQNAELVNGVNALLGLLQLLSHRVDLPSEVLEVLRNNHRIDEAHSALRNAGAEV